LHTAENYARESGAARIILSTQTSNSTAQRLYASLGYRKDQELHHLRWRYRRIIALTCNTSLSRLIDAVIFLGNVALKRVTM
jgi:ribosomal protein S18 acetylase RimI-like enzyme